MLMVGQKVPLPGIGLKEVLTEFTFGIWAKMMKQSIMNDSNLIDKTNVL